MKQTLALIAAVALVCGCQASHDPAFWQAWNQAGQQNYQQQMTQQAQWNQQFMQMQQQRLQQQQMQAQQQRQNSDSAAYNPYTGQSQYVPPGWHKIWDSNNNTWIIQPN